MPYSAPISASLIDLARTPNTQAFVRLASNNKKASLSGERAQETTKKTCQNLLKIWPHLSQDLVYDHLPYLRQIEHHLQTPEFSQYSSRYLRLLQKKIKQTVARLELSLVRPLPDPLLKLSTSFLPLNESYFINDIYELGSTCNTNQNAREIKSLAHRIFVKYQLMERKGANCEEGIKEILQKNHLFFRSSTEHQHLFFKYIAEIITLKCGGQEKFLHALCHALPSSATYLNLSALSSMPRPIEEESATIHLLAASHHLENLQYLRLQTSSHQNIPHNKKEKVARKKEKFKAAVEALAGGQYLNQLRSLALINFKHSIHNAIVILSNNPAMENLKALDLSDCDQVVDATLSAIGSGCQNNLEDLNFSGCHQITDTGLLSLITGGTIEHLSHLNILECPRITLEGVTALAHSPLIDENTQLEAAEDLKEQFALEISNRFRNPSRQEHPPHALVKAS